MHVARNERKSTRLRTRLYAPYDSDGVCLGELAAFGDAFEQFSADCELEGEVVLRPRFEPLVKLDLQVHQSPSYVVNS